MYCKDGAGGGGGGGGGPTLEQLQASIMKLEAKNAELLDEAKNAKRAKQQAEADAEERAAEAARKAGDFESLYKSEQTKRAEKEAELQDLREKTSQEKVKRTALKMAMGLADGENAELLAEFVGRRLRVDGDDIKVTDGSGALTVSTLDDLKAEFEKDPKYTALRRGVKSSGGGAGGGGSGGGAAEKTMIRTEFDALPKPDQAAFIKAGGRLVND